MNVEDSSGWLEYFAEPLQDIENVLVPAICYYEVFKVIVRERSTLWTQDVDFKNLTGVRYITKK